MDERLTPEDARRFRLLEALFHHRWAAPVLAEMSRLTDTVGGGRTALLLSALGAPRESLRKTLAALIESLEWIRPNPGYGHPLRPEYVLTNEGMTLGAWCGLLVAVVESLGVHELAFRKWTMPVLDAIDRNEGAARFNEIKYLLPTVTPRALAQSLKDLDAAGLVERAVEDEYPPTTWYRLTAEGRRLARVLRSFPDLPEP